jgi:hypothetical protein
MKPASLCTDVVCSEALRKSSPTLSIAVSTRALLDAPYLAKHIKSLVIRPRIEAARYEMHRQHEACEILSLAQLVEVNEQVVAIQEDSLEGKTVFKKLPKWSVQDGVKANNINVVDIIAAFIVSKASILERIEISTGVGLMVDTHLQSSRYWARGRFAPILH